MSVTASKPPRPGDIQILSQIFEHRLAKSGRGEAGETSSAERAVLIAKFGGLLQRLSSLMKITDEQRGSMSLDTILARLMEIVSDALDADRSTLFLYERQSDQLFSRVAQGGLVGDIRLASTQGIAGLVYTSGVSVIIPDAYADSRFNPEVDKTTGYKTRNILCAPVRNWDGKIIGVTEVLNKLTGDFNEEDRALLDALTSHAAAALESSQLYESVEKALQDEAQLLGVTAALSSELHLDVLLDKIMSITTSVLDADRSTLFLHDPATDELWSKVAEGMESREIRFPASAGIAGSVFKEGVTINIQDAYADDRFNQAIDKATGYRTSSILCMPVLTNAGKTIGVTQVLNKRGGPFGARDEKRLQALAAQAAIALENARLFEDVLNARNYSESILKSMSNGVITLDTRRRIIKVNQAALRILGFEEGQLINESAGAVFGGDNGWILEGINRVGASHDPDMTLDANFIRRDGRTASINLNIQCLEDAKERPIGFILLLEDITSEKRVRTTMARYMDRELADRLIESGDALLGGTAQPASVLFSDIRSFTAWAEKLGARETLSMLNSYFSEMVDVVFRHRGILDKYIGDAMMAVFGTPFPGPEDADHAVGAGIEMMVTLGEFNRKRALQGWEPVEIRIGVSTGEVVAGNVGSPKRMEYTVIGDSVNLAARLEGANKFYGTHILISQYTYRALNRDYPVRELDLIRVRGREEPVAVYEVLALNGEDGPGALERCLQSFAAGLESYRHRSWSEAARHFSAALSHRPSDRPARVFLDRSQHYCQHPPSRDWDGVWTLTEK